MEICISLNLSAYQKLSNMCSLTVTLSKKFGKYLVLILRLRVLSVLMLSLAALNVARN